MQRVLAGLVVWTLVVAAGSADATVYRWRDADGALHFSNDSADVPPGEPEAFHSFTTRAPARVATESGAPAVSPLATGGVVGDPPGEYERGLAAGIELGEQQLRAAAELAAVMVERVPEAPPAWVPIPQPEPGVSVSIIRAPRRWFPSSGPSIEAGPWFDGLSLLVAVDCVARARRRPLRPLPLVPLRAPRQTRRADAFGAGAPQVSRVRTPPRDGRPA
jgi:hypothetical protein